jgi:hypothetical protein
MMMVITASHRPKILLSRSPAWDQTPTKLLFSSLRLRRALLSNTAFFSFPLFEPNQTAATRIFRFHASTHAASVWERTEPAATLRSQIIMLARRIYDTSGLEVSVIFFNYFTAPI